MTKPRVLYWFRTDLRLHDSPALKAALDLDPECLYPIWTWDPHYVYRARVGPNRWKFLLDCQNDLSASITKLNKKSKLFVLREAPTTVLPKLFKAWKITHLVFEKDSDPYAKDRDDEVIKLSEQAGVETIIRVGRTLYDPDVLVQKNGGKPTMSITQVINAGNKIGDISRPIAAPKKLPDPGDTKLDFDQERPPSDPDFNAEQRDGKEESYAKLAGPKGDFSVPTMEELGLKPATGKHPGGETVALKDLGAILDDKKYTATFEKPKTAPTAFDPQATTLMSPHLHFGSISCREFYWRVQDVVDNYKGTPSQPPTSLTGQLLFRDMYFGAQARLGHEFGQTFGNSHCRFVPWHLPSKINSESGLYTGEYTIDSPEAEEWFQRWKFGRTGFPWIDALMRQLRQEGWIHHLGRHAVACFLTRGGCYIDWQRGADVFEEWLIDHEPACNVGNWQWLSCTAFYAQFYRCYSPIAFPQKWDKEGVFIRHYVPELKDYPVKYIYEPWKCPIVDQKKAGCVVQGDGSTDTKSDKPQSYPKPMFDFGERRKICIDGMKNAYHVNLYGNSPKVLDGTWKSLFDDSAEGPTEGKKTSANDSSPNVETDHGSDADDQDGGSAKKRKRVGNTWGNLLNLENLEQTCPLDNGRHEASSYTGHSSRNLASIEKLPPELMDMVLIDLDLRTLTTLRSTSRPLRSAVDALWQYHDIVIYAAYTIRAALSLNVASGITCRALHQELCSRTCVNCGQFGPILYLLSCGRICYVCLSDEVHFLPLRRLNARYEFGLGSYELASLPSARSIPGRYAVGGKTRSTRSDWIDYSAAREAGIKLHGSVDQMEKYATPDPNFA
ncbi:MAG: hypothetical protein M4579_005034 [Chaenotheca gracillima]|nr:MAG: hypothetical protein M4579_005034 [Chaenotheca gracillima]